jgi:SAM-dependent methyltransferase
MNPEIISFTNWLQTPPGRYLQAWEEVQFDQAVSDIFGYHALQLGFVELNTLRANRMPHQWQAATDILADVSIDAKEQTSGPAPSSLLRAALVTDSGALPFPAASLDLVVLPHTLELSDDAHVTLREVERVLVPEGRVVISGFNPASLWGMRQRRAHVYARFGRKHLFLPEAGDFIGYWRLRDWLRLLSFEVESARFGCYRPALATEKWLARFEWMDRIGQRSWPIFGAVYFLVAVKRVRGMRLMEPAWKVRKSVPAAPAVVANKNPRLHTFNEPLEK